MKDAINHSQAVHKMNVRMQSLAFPNFDDFIEWKQEEETKTHSNYVLMCAPQSYQTYKHHYYYCNRSGRYNPKGRNTRNLKVQGSCKVGNNCLAHIKTKTNTETGLAKVEYCNHHNHTVSLGHLKLPQNIRVKIASQLQQGIPADKIMDIIRNSMYNGINRGHIITKQDIRNVQNQYNIQGISRHPNDLTSVCAWVEEFKESPHNPIILFKAQGKQPENMENVGTDDFILVLQTQFQLDMLKANGNKCICMVQLMELTCMRLC